MDTLSNTARFYLSRFEEVCRLFEKIESDGWEEPCFDLLSDERLPLARRVVLHYFAAFSDASEPDVHLRQGREVIKSIDKMIESGVMGPLPWLAKQKEAYDELEATLELEDADNLSEGDNLVEAPSATLIGTEMSDDDIMTDTPETMNAMTTSPLVSCHTEADQDSNQQHDCKLSPLKDSIDKDDEIAFLVGRQ